MTTTTSAPSSPPPYEPGEWEARLDLAAAYRLAAQNGWQDMLGTHFSLRLPQNPHHYLINPYGLLFEEVTASSLLKIDLNGQLIHGGSLNFLFNPAADEIHGAVLSSRPDIHAIMHLHSVAGTGVSAQQEGLLPISQNALNILHRVRYYDYGGAGLDTDERARLVDSLGDGSVLFMRNHGTLTAGRTIGEAFALLHRLERACQIQLAAQAGGQLHTVAAAVVEKQIERSKRIYTDQHWSPGAKHEWAALRRKVARDHPDFAL
ncbi:hypothetical protein E9531_14905 [Lampropedia puyangensis]|uniref:Class II aldolase/adducin N-terminal domain-containing protein n=1 Tax=Lampropedia puyangensis TaxID=1330072 RepID=A0A4S8ETA0_9BURK|nr:class II aldolase/adducin family protein [Lampropedia puyangensis]THT98087.1 hypothetical protein E9531_14905 [Lampropedia puyangensis]